LVRDLIVTIDAASSLRFSLRWTPPERRPIDAGLRLQHGAMPMSAPSTHARLPACRCPRQRRHAELFQAARYFRHAMSLPLPQRVAAIFA
jgi:hypothetical protein